MCNSLPCVPEAFFFVEVVRANIKLGFCRAKKAS